MRLLENKGLATHNGDPRTWNPGIYRSQRNNGIVIVVTGSVDGRDKRTAIAVSSGGACAPVSSLTDGYALLPSGETIKLEA